MVCAPKERRIVATGEAQPGVCPAERNPWQLVVFCLP